MSIGKTQREILLRAYRSIEWEIVFKADEMTCDRRAILRAAHALEARGIVELSKMIPRFTYPKVTRLCLRLTEAGRAFCNIYETQLVTGGRIRASRYQAATGHRLPGMRPEGYGSWLRKSMPADAVQG